MAYAEYIENFRSVYLSVRLWECRPGTLGSGRFARNPRSAVDLGTKDLTTKISFAGVERLGARCARFLTVFSQRQKIGQTKRPARNAGLKG